MLVKEGGNTYRGSRALILSDSKSCSLVRRSEASGGFTGKVNPAKCMLSVTMKRVDCKPS